ncbi:MAG TPA: hypothetical protein VI854_02810, partial [Acidimicrobiia bacterium]|nr:hypothetical protein [Acidimicrobiia bacterium]
ASGAESVRTAEFLGDVGDVSDPAVVRELLAGDADELMAAQAEKAGAEDATSLPAAEGSRVPVPNAAPAGDATATAGASTEEGDGVDRAAVDRCGASLASGPARGSRMTALALGTYEGRPAVLAAFATGSGTTVYVTAREDCRVLTRYDV